MREPLFRRRIDGWASWGEVFCDQDAFLPLARAIFEKEGLPPPAALSGLTPGTNAVFRAGDTVVKIFAPMESGLDSAHDFAVERAGLTLAAEAGVPVSTPIAFGCLEDAYAFRYIIMEWIDAREAGDVLPSYTVAQKEGFAQALRGLLRRLNRTLKRLPFAPVDIVARAMENPRLAALPEALADAMRTRAAQAVLSAPVFVHGDLTGENVLIRPDGGLVLIDFADSNMAPPLYEEPPVLFELFRGDRTLVRAFMGEEPLEAFIERLLTALSLHDFGADIVRSALARLGIPLSSVQSLSALAQILRERWR